MNMKLIMKKILTICSFFTFFLTAQAQVTGGTYVIQTSNTDPNFRTLAAAITRINNVGVSGPVVLALAQNQTPTAPIVINAFSGSSATNTLTIRPNTGQTVSVSGAFTNRGVIEFNGADFVTIEGNNTSENQRLTIYNTFNDNSNAFTNRAAIRMYGGATNNRIQNCIIRTNMVGVTNGVFSIGIYAGGNSDFVADGNNATNFILNNQFVEVKQAVWVRGASANSNSGWEIRNNTVGSTNDNLKPYYGFYLANVGNVIVSNNILNGVRRPNSLGGNPLYGGIFITGGNAEVYSNTLQNFQNASGNNTDTIIFIEGSNATVYQNRINSVSSNSTTLGVHAIQITGNNATVSRNEIYSVRTSVDKIATGIYNSGNNAVIHTNMIANVSSAGGGDPGSQAGHGIYLNSGNNVSVYFNSVLLRDNQSTGASACLYVNSGNNFDIRNNIFINQQTSGSSRFAFYTNETQQNRFNQLDYNDYVSAQHIGSWGSYFNNANIRTNLTSFRTASGKDQNSISVAPSFVSDTNLRLAAEVSGFDNEGLFLTGYETDIDFQERSTTAPDIGADEFSRCNNTTAWNGTTWSNGAPTINSAVQINGNYTTGTSGSISACELTVKNGVTLTISANTTVTVENNIFVNGNLTIDSNGSLIQVNENATHTGSINVKRRTSPLKSLDYVYWSSPVSQNQASVLVNGEPTLTYRYDPTVSTEPINCWVFVQGNEILNRGVGYIARAPENIPYNPTNTYEVTFSGVPHTGPISIPVSKNGIVTSNLIGNPYPSALDADLFLGNTNNSSILTGTIYLWTHNTAISAQTPGSYGFNYSANDYALYNLTGSIKGIPAASGGVRPNGKIASGQGFFVVVRDNLSDGTRNLTVNNSMRARNADSNNQFFRAAPQMQASAFSETQSGASRFWLNIMNPDGAYNETLIGYIPGATNELDYGFDGEVFDGGNFFTFYSILEDKNLSIQGRESNFNENDVIPLGYSSTLETPASIGIESFDGIFGNQAIYLVDKELDTVTNLQEGRYYFTTGIGTFNERFELRYTAAPLSTEQPQSTTAVQLIKSGAIIGVSSGTDSIQSVNIFDISGKKIGAYNANNANLFYIDDVAVQNRLLILQITLANGSTINRKLIH